LLNFKNQTKNFKTMNPIKAEIMNEAHFNSFYGENAEYSNDMYAAGIDDIYMQGQPQAIENAGNSVPFIITLTNTSGAAINNVNFLNAVESYKATNDGVTEGVTPTVGYAGKTYSGLLAYLLSADIVVGSFYIYATTNAQATESILFRTDNQRGKALEDTVIPDIHHFQNQTGLAYVEQEVIITKYTKATLASIAANAVVKIKLFPSKRTGAFGTQVQYGRPTFIATQAGMKVPALGR
jgi:hypothetical protein